MDNNGALEQRVILLEALVSALLSQAVASQSNGGAELHLALVGLGRVSVHQIQQRLAESQPSVF